MILAEQLLARVLRDVAELAVDVGDFAAGVGGGDDCRLIEGEVGVGQILGPRLQIDGPCLEFEPRAAELTQHRWRD